MPRILDGNRVRDDIKNDLKPRIEALLAKGRTPGLAVVLVGSDPASAIYVRNKIKTCRDLGIHSESITPPDTVTTCHSKTPDLAAVCREADILVAAIGRPALITADFIKPGATVIDVGTNYLDNREMVARIFRNSEEKLAVFDKKGSVLVGDVDPVDVVERAGAYTPVPGGVGPLTIAMLMVNTVASAERRAGVC